MRCPDARRWLAAGAACLSLACHGAADGVKAEIAARLKAQLPEFTAADYVLGSAALDAEARAQAESAPPPSAALLETGRKLWTRKFKNGRSLAGCFPNGGRRVAASYPQYDARLKLVITLETAINQCLKAHREPLLEAGDAATMGAATAYLRSLSNGQKIAVRVPAAAESRFEQGRRLYFSRLGQRNYACASCHLQNAGKRFDDVPLSPAIGQAARWPYPREGGALTLQMRMRQCLELMGAAPFPAGSDELNHLEYFLSYLSNGLPLKANVAR